MRYLPLEPRSLTSGLALFTLMPTTLVSGIAMVENAGGNVPIAVILSIVTNFVALFILPFSIPLVLGNQFSTDSFDSLEFAIKMIPPLLAPFVAGTLMSDFIPGVSRVINLIAWPLSLLNSICIMLLVWVEVSSSAESLKLLSTAPIFELLGFSVLLHLVLIGSNFGLIFGILGWAERDLAVAKSLVMMSAQKSILVMIPMVDLLPFRFPGYVAIAGVCGSIIQIVLHSILTAYFHNVTSWGNSSLREDVHSADANVTSSQPSVPSSSEKAPLLPTSPDRP
jgi:sodium/bile acid cotransporter 7